MAHISSQHLQAGSPAAQQSGTTEDDLLAAVIDEPRNVAPVRRIHHEAFTPVQREQIRPHTSSLVLEVPPVSDGLPYDLTLILNDPRTGPDEVQGVHAALRDGARPDNQPRPLAPGAGPGCF